MAFINLKDKIVQVKIVYYGPGRGGKTTNLEYIYEMFKKRVKTEMVSIKTHGDRTLFFDFLPFDMGKIRGFDIRIQLYTVPGQVQYNATRRLVLNGVDGVVFVADSNPERRTRNIETFEDLKENLAFYQKDIHTIPLVLQYNKRDLRDQGTSTLDIETLDSDLNAEVGAPAYPASAINGFNVVPTLKTIISSTVVSLEKELN